MLILASIFSSTPVVRGLCLFVLQAVALCSFLDNNREMVNLQEKEVLELGAGTGLVTIVASLLGERSSIQFRQHINKRPTQTSRSVKQGKSLE